MKRLTQKDSNGAYKLKTMNSDLVDSVINVGIALRLLGKYEDTGLIPSEIEQLQKENAELKSRLEKQIPKEIILWEGHSGSGVCPNCGENILKHQYCPLCGQALKEREING